MVPPFISGVQVNRASLMFSHSGSDLSAPPSHECAHNVRVVVTQLRRYCGGGGGRGVLLIIFLQWIHGIRLYREMSGRAEPYTGTVNL